MMLDDILNALKDHNELAGWSLREIHTRSSQLYAVPSALEADRLVESTKYKLNVFSQGKAEDGSATLGQGDVTILPGSDIEAAIQQAALVAELVSNPLYSLPAPAVLPELELSDPEVAADPQGTMQALMARMRQAGNAIDGVRMTGGECFADVIRTRLLNSRGIDAQQEETMVSIEFVLRAGRDGREVESFEEMSRRRARDLNIEAAIEERARLTADLLAAGPPPNWQGPVVIRDHTLAGYLAGDDLFGGVLQFQASGESKFAKVSSWEVGKPVFRGEVKGDPFTLWGNRTLPFGTVSSRFDAEGLPASRVELIRENTLVNFSSSQKYADYLGLPATGDFGCVEVAPGKTPAADLLQESYVEVVQFSWFNPDPITGDFATEIRLGYLVENGVRKPFRGGQLIGNYMESLANVRWSQETGFFGNYLGPTVARFGELKIS
jgi:PmbA protein